MKTTNRNSRRLRSSLRSSVSVFFALGVVAGCSSVPDAINPVQWYSNSVEFFADGNAANTKKNQATPTQQKAAAASWLTARMARPLPGLEHRSCLLVILITSHSYC